MEVAEILKALAAMGFSSLGMAAVAILWRINNQFQLFDKRLTIVEIKQQTQQQGANKNG